MSTSETVTSAIQPVSAAEQYIFNDSVAARAAFNRRTATADGSHLLPHLSPGLRVVDFGCGTGSITLGVAAAVAPGEVMGFDTSEVAISQAVAQARQAGLTNAHFTVANINALELPDESFDVAHFSGILSHLSEPGTALKLAYRVLRPGGVIAAREPQKEGDWFGGPYCEAVSLYNRLLIDDWKAAGGDPFLARRFGPLLREAGFERVELVPGCAPALSLPVVWASAVQRLAEPEFAARVVQRGWVTADELATMADAIVLWAASADSVAATAECTAIGWKPAQRSGTAG